MKWRNFIINSLKDIKLWGLFFLLQFPSLRVLHKYLPCHLHKFIPLFLLFSFFAYALFLRPQRPLKLIKVLFSPRFIFISLILLVVLVNFFVYPLADNLKYCGRGSDQDDALIVSGKNLISGKNPYEAHTYFSANPLSPGPGWVILNIPFTVTGLYFLLTPAYLLILLFFVRIISGGYYLPNIFLILCMSSLAFWETMVVGSDMFALGVLFTLCLFAVFYSINKSRLLLSLSCLLLAFTATSRVVFIYAILIMGILVWRKSRFKHLIYLAAGMTIALALHFIFYLWNTASYTPLHIFSKGDKSLLPGFKIAAPLLSFSVLVLAYAKVRYSITIWLFFFCLCLGVPLFFVSLGDLIAIWHYNLAQWEGANYFMVVLPIYLSYFVLQLDRNE